MLTQQQLAALAFAVSRARAFTGDDAPAVAVAGVSQAEEVLDVLRARIDKHKAQCTAALGGVERTAAYIRRHHPHGADATIAELDVARLFLVQQLELCK